MENLAVAIQQAYPDAILSPDPGPNCVVLGGDAILYWGLSSPQPDPAQIVAAFDPAKYALRQLWAEQKRARDLRNAQRILKTPLSSQPTAAEMQARLDAIQTVNAGGL